MKKNRILLTAGIIFLVACLCLTIIAAVTGGVLLLRSSRINLFATATPTAAPPPTSAPAQLPTPISEATPVPGATESSSVPADIASQMDTIQSDVAQMRGLNQPPDVNRALLTVDQLKQKVENNFLKDYTQTDVTDDVRVLSSFGLLEPGYDLYDLYLKLYTEQIAGYYDLETREMYVVLDQGFHGPQRSTYAHEYTHALQEYNYQVREKLNYNEEYCKKDSEYCAAIQSLIEGDASITEQSWLMLYGTAQDRKEIDQYYQNTPLSVYDSAPAFLKEDFVFPYRQGVDFVLSLFEKGNFAAIDKAYSDPPVSTEQILHPAQYPDDKPVTVDLPDIPKTLGRDLRELDRNVMGEWYTYLILGRGIKPAFQLPDDTAKKAAAGWGGDAYAVYWDEAAGKPVVILKTVWDTAPDASEFAAAFQTYGTGRWGQPGKPSTAGDTTWTASDGSSTLRLTNRTTIWVMAPSSGDAETLMQALAAGTN